MVCARVVVNNTQFGYFRCRSISLFTHYATLCGARARSRRTPHRMCAQIPAADPTETTSHPPETQFHAPVSHRTYAHTHPQHKFAKSVRARRVYVYMMMLCALAFAQIVRPNECNGPAGAFHLYGIVIFLCQSCTHMSVFANTCPCGGQHAKVPDTQTHNALTHHKHHTYSRDNPPFARRHIDLIIVAHAKH